MFSLILALLSIKFSSAANKTAAYKRTFFYFLENQGGIYIKFLQLLSVNPEFTAGWAGPKEMRVFENVELEPLDITRYLHPANFTNLETQPFAAGSFAQVYRGTLLNGQEVAIKILRPSVVQNLHRDIKRIKIVLKIASYFLSSSVIDFNVAASEFCENALLETDYQREIANLEYFAKHYQDHEKIIIPRAYPELSNTRVIVQDFIPGPTLAEILSARTPRQSAIQLTKELTGGSDLWQQLTVAGSELLSDTFVSDFGIGDPHPGNIKLLPDNKIGFIDFGIIASPPANRQAFYDYVVEFLRVGRGYKKVDKVLYACLNFFCPGLVTALQHCQITDAKSGKTISIMDSLLQAFNDKVSTFQGDEKIRELFNKGRMFRLVHTVLDRHNILDIKINEQDFMFMKSCNIFLNTLHTIDQGADRSRYAECFFECLDYSLKKADRYGLKDDHNSQLDLTTSESYEMLADLLSSVANKDQYLFERLAYRI